MTINRPTWTNWPIWTAIAVLSCAALAEGALIWVKSTQPKPTNSAPIWISKNPMRSYATTPIRFSVHDYKFLIPKNDVLFLSALEYPSETKALLLDLVLQYPTLSGLSKSNAACLGWSKYKFWLNSAYCLDAIYVGIGGVPSAPHDIGDGGRFNMASIPKQDLVRDHDLYIYKTRWYKKYPNEPTKTYLVPYKKDFFDVMWCTHIPSVKRPGTIHNANMCAVPLYSPPLKKNERDLKIVIQFSDSYRYLAVNY